MNHHMIKDVVSHSTVPVCAVSELSLCLFNFFNAVSIKEIISVPSLITS